MKFCMKNKKEYFLDILSEQKVNGQTFESKNRFFCKMKVKNNFGKIFYEEVLENNTTFSTIKILGPNKVVIERKSSRCVSFVFEKKKKHKCDYFTEYGIIYIDIFTHEINVSFENNLKIEIIYTISKDNLKLSDNKVIISVWEG